ncbi:glycosyltransferase family 2 protein [Pseudoroseicyclus aestuarii]|uniref:Glycosyl transferase family 2 n=1 Tax=Pseudoroseicyclus aestuarii TaxID=1795041 RepID=A0A318SVP8_9RHOB|nr:glycosyl transferase family 2 [Pseudoroseicyclus aestuarii]
MRTAQLRQALRLRRKRQRLLWRAFRARHALTPRIDRTRGLPRGAILCLCCLRNEMAQLPLFLDHHRRLGVDHFLFVDNGSDDGSLAFLAAQPDVSVWSTAASYRDARFGMDWLGWLLMRHGHGRWCLTLDADERLIYPFWTTRPLPALTAWLDHGGQEALGALMLDLYPQGRLSEAGAPEDLLWFDAGNYTLRQQAPGQALWIQGGPRARAFFADAPRRAPTLNKVPLVRWHRRYAYLNAAHTLLPPRLNRTYASAGGEALTGVLLHGKFLGAIVEKSAEELVRRQHFGDPARAAAYQRALMGDPVLKTPQSTRYTGWRQLVALGLMSRGGWP